MRTGAFARKRSLLGRVGRGVLLERYVGPGRMRAKRKKRAKMTKRQLVAERKKIKDLYTEVEGGLKQHGIKIRPPKINRIMTVEEQIRSYEGWLVKNVRGLKAAMTEAELKAVEGERAAKELAVREVIEKKPITTKEMKFKEQVELAREMVEQEKAKALGEEIVKKTIKEVIADAKAGKIDYKIVDSLVEKIRTGGINSLAAEEGMLWNLLLGNPEARAYIKKKF